MDDPLPTHVGSSEAAYTLIADIWISRRWAVPGLPGEAMSRAKLMLFSHVCGDSFITGAEKYLLTLACELGRHADCTLVVPRDGLLRQEAAKKGIPSVIHPVPLVWEMYRPEAETAGEVQRIVEARAHSKTADLLHQYQPDLVLVNTCVHVYPALAAKALGIPVVWLIAETMADTPFTPQAAALIHGCADLIVGISETVLEPLRRAGFGDKLALLPPTWHRDELEPASWAESRAALRRRLGLHGREPLIGFIASSLHQEKGLEHFVRMAASLADLRSDVRFAIAGVSTDAEYISHCERLIAASGHAGRFYRLDFESRIQSLYPAIDLVVVPSLVAEGFGMVALEGLIFGKGVIAYRSGGLEEILLGTDNGRWLVERGDTRGLTAKALEWLEAPDGEAAGAANIRAAASAYGIDRYRLRLRGLLRRLQASLDAAAARRTGRTPQLKEYALYRGHQSNAVFLIEGGKKRPFASEEALAYYRYSWQDVNAVADEELHALETGTPIRPAPLTDRHRPAVMLARGEDTTVYLLAGGRRFPFSSMERLLERGYDPERVVPVEDDELRRLPAGRAL